jgi:hypothetical protein
MAQSAKKRSSANRKVNRKSQLKFKKRIENNIKILRKLS